MTNRTALALALALAREYKELTGRGDVARMTMIRLSIENLVGWFEGGKLTLPDQVVVAMGNRPIIYKDIVTP